MTPLTIAHQAPLSTEFSRQERWSRLPLPSPGDLPDPEIKPTSLALQADSLPLSPWESHECSVEVLKDERKGGGCLAELGAEMWVGRAVDE